MILITGASGYVGKSFVSKYKNLYDFKTFSLQKQSIDELDLSDVDIVVHLAALVHQMNGALDSEYERINVEYTIDLAMKAKAANVKHFVFMSSLAVYGDSQDVLTETSNCNPKTPYGKSKLKAEEALLRLVSDDFVVSIIRPPMIYGYNAPGNIKTLIGLVKKVSILPFGGIENKRSFVYIDNLLSMMDKIIKLKKGGIFLAADDNAISTTKLIYLIARGLNKKIFFIKIPFFIKILKILKPNIYDRLYTDLEIDNVNTKKILDYKNKYSVEEGINLTVFKDN